MGGGRLGEKPAPCVERGASADVAELEAGLEAELEGELEVGPEALAVGGPGDCAAGIPAGMELIPGFEDTIDSHFMAALLQDDADSQAGAAEGVKKGASGGDGGENDGCGIDLSLGLAETPLNGCDAPPTAAAASSVAASADGGPSALPEEKLGVSPESMGLAQEEREGHRQGDSSVDGPSTTSDGLEAAWRSDEEEGEVGGATPSPVQPPSSPAAPAEAAAASESVSPLPPSPPPLPPQPLSAAEPPLPTATVAAAAAAAPPPLPSPRLPPSVTPPVTAPACVAASGAEKKGSSRVTKRSGRKRENEEDNEQEEEKEKEEEKKEPCNRNPAAAPTLHKTARERRREAAAAATAEAEKKAAPVTASTRAGNAVEEGTGEPCPDVAASDRTVCGGLSGADGKGGGVDGGLSAEGAAPLQEAATASPSSLGMEAPGGVLDEAVFDAGPSVSDWELPPAAEPRTLPRKVSLRFVPRDQATKDRVAERGYLPFQKLTAPVSGICDAERRYDQVRRARGTYFWWSMWALCYQQLGSRNRRKFKF